MAIGAVRWIGGVTAPNTDQAPGVKRTQEFLDAMQGHAPVLVVESGELYEIDRQGQDPPRPSVGPNRTWH
jgi:hypothetical protein